MNNGNQPAYPIDCNKGLAFGLTKREYMATAIMSGLCAHSTRRGTYDAYAKDSVTLADALLAELDKTTKGNEQ